jgi:hypothetical protein
MGKRLLYAGFCALASIYLSSSSSRQFLIWTIVQWMPLHLREPWIHCVWESWEQRAIVSDTASSFELQIPIILVQEHRHDLSSYLESTYGKDWMRRPLLLKGIWTLEELQSESRRLSLEGLLEEQLRIPYFTDARQKDALTPDGYGSVQSIVHNISRGAPHKIGSQLIVQTYPDLVREVAPTKVVTELFGDYFKPESVIRWGPFGWLPAFTTVPLFVAHHIVVTDDSAKTAYINGVTNQAKPFTALHCEPIGNVAVQLSGQKNWILVSPEYSHRLRPATAPDRRAFIASYAGNYSHIPHYQATTYAGDAIWVPTWTWHRVDYVESVDMSIGGSLFHFRIVDFVRNNPWFAFVIVPSLILELVGCNTQ